MNRPLRFFVIFSLVFNLIMLTSCDDSSVSARFIVSGNEYALLSADSSSGLKLPPDPEMEGYAFLGWYLGEGEGSRVFTLDSLIPGETVTVYAKWTEIHVHVESEERIFKAPTCTSDGIAFTECEGCGVKMSTSFIDQLSHDLSDWLTDAHPTCTEDGAAHKECLVCVAVIESRVIPALSHNERTLAGEAPTETRDGITEGKDCLRCGEMLIPQVSLPATITGTDLVIDGFEKSGTDLSAALGSPSDRLSPLEIIKINEASSLTLSRDADGTDIINGDISLSFGENTFYATVASGDDVTVYTVTVYRKRAFTVTFNTRGSAVEPITVDEGEVIKTVPVSHLAGYDFSGWDIDLTLPVTESVCASAIHIPRKDTPYTVVYYITDGEDHVEAYREICVGETDTLSIIPAYLPERYRIDSDKSDAPALIKGDGSLALSVYLEHIKYTVSFNTGAGVPIPSETVLALEPYSPPIPPERSGYRFDGWLLGGDSFTGVESMTEDVSLVASWVRLATVTFDTSSIAGFTVDPVTVDVGARVDISLEYPSTRELTVGFFLNGSPWIIGYSTVTEDITVIAEWVDKSVTVTFESKGAEPPAPITVDYGSIIESVPTPYRGNTYSFEGWYIKGSDIRWIPGITPVTSDITVVARWSIMTPPDVWG